MKGLMIVRKVFLENLPKKEGWGVNKGKLQIDWKSSVGYIVNFIYDDINGSLEIVDYKEHYIWVKNYKGIINKIDTNSFKNGNLARLLGKVSINFKLEIGYEVIDDKRNLIITDRKYNINKNGQPYKYYQYKCNKCGYEGWIVESSLITRKTGCQCCNTIGRKTTVLGINTIWDTDRWMVNLGVSEEDAKKHTKGSHKKIKVKCPECNREKYISVKNIYRHKSIKCICGDGISYPEKFVSEFLKQLQINNITQLSKNTFKWCNKYYYDFYLVDYDTIIETHGKQHYEDTSGIYVKTLKEEQENDKTKEELALKNGIRKYIVIDCRYSEIEHIKKNILNSELSVMFDLSKIDWLKCEEFALKNIVKEVCDYWNNKKEWETTVTIAKIFNINYSTVREYVKKGTELGWCFYDATKEMMKITRENGRKRAIAVEIFKENVSLGKFPSSAELERVSIDEFGIILNRTAISSICRNKYPCDTYKGFTFKYIE